MQKSASGFRHGHDATGRSAVSALFGAVATVVVLAGVVAIAASPRSLSEDARLPVSAERFEVAPIGAKEPPAEFHAVTPPGRILDDPVQLTYEGQG